jgi:hypothetical protein
MIRTIRIEDRTYAVGLWWQVRPDGPASKGVMLKLAKETAVDFAAEGYNYVALRPDHYGLGHQADHLPPRTASLAAAFRPLGQQDAFLGVFRLAESLWWVCGLVRGTIAPDGDAVFETKAEALAQADKMRFLIEAVGLTEVVFESSEASLAYLSPLLWPETTLRPLDKTERYQGLLQLGRIAVVLLSAICLGGYFLHSSYQARQKARITAQSLAERDARKNAQLTHPERYFQKTWLEAPDFISAGKQCAAAVLSLPLSANAWKFEEAVCRPGAMLKVSWAHTRGASFVSPPGEARLVTPQQALENRPLSGLAGRPPSADSLPLMTREQATAALYLLTQNLGSQLSLSWEAPEHRQIEDETTVIAPWQRGRFELSHLPAATLLGPDVFEALSLPGTTLVSLTWKNNDLNIEGYIHVLSSN